MPRQPSRLCMKARMHSITCPNHHEVRCQFPAAWIRLSQRLLMICGSKPFIIRALIGLTRPGAVNRSGEYRPGETAFSPPSARASVQPLPHNPRKQRKNPTAAGSGERFREGKWRSRRDSNPRDGFPSAPLAGVCLQPLGQFSAKLGL